MIAPLTSNQLRAMFIDDRFYGYGLDLCAFLHYPSLSEVAAVVPHGSAQLLELTDLTGVEPDTVPSDHPLRALHEEGEPSVWISLAGTLLLLQYSNHPSASAFADWVGRQRDYESFFDVPPDLLDEGLDLLAWAFGPTVTMLAEIMLTEAGRTIDPIARVLDPPPVYNLTDLLGSCFEDEAFEDQNAGV
ncbi:hypothetical protein [Flindersiella endophytica]